MRLDCRDEYRTLIVVLERLLYMSLAMSHIYTRNRLSSAACYNVHSMFNQFTGQSQRSGRIVHDSFAIFNWLIPYVIKLLGYPKIGVWIRLRVSIDLIRLIYASAISASLWLHWASNCDWCSVGWTLVQMLWFGEITAHYIRFWYRNDVYLGRRISQEIIFERNFWNSNRACYFEMFPEKYLFVFRSDVKSADQITEQHLI